MLTTRCLGAPFVEALLHDLRNCAKVDLRAFGKGDYCLPLVVCEENSEPAAEQLRDLCAVTLTQVGWCVAFLILGSGES